MGSNGFRLSAKKKIPKIPEISLNGATSNYII
jgi:hypothetical protein